MMQRTKEYTSIPIISLLLAVLLLGLASRDAVAAPEADIDELSYTIQIKSSSSLEGAGISYDSLVSHYNDPDKMKDLAEDDLDSLRIEQVGTYYTVRIGKFKDKNSAQILLNTINDTFPDAIILHANIKPERIRRSYGPAGETSSTTADAQPNSNMVSEKTKKDEAQDIPPVAQIMAMKQASPSATAEATGPPPAPPEPLAQAPQAPAAVDPVSQIMAMKQASEPIAVQPQQSSPAAAPETEPAQPATMSPDTAPATKTDNSIPDSPTSTTYLGDYSHYIGLVLIILLLAGAFKIMQKKQSATALLGINMDQKSQLDIPRLSDAMETKLVRNLRELQLFEGNVLSVDSDVKTIYVTSSFPKEGKTSTAVNIAYALALNKAVKVLLIDGNSSSPKLHKLFGAKQSPGMVECLISKSIVDGAIRQTAYDNLSIVPIGGGKGDTAGQSTTFIESDNLKNLIDQMKSQYDYVVYDGHSILGSSHATIHANICDGIVIVVECEKTKWQVVTQGLEQLKKRRGNILGVVMNKRKFYIPRFLYGKI